MEYSSLNFIFPKDMFVSELKEVLVVYAEWAERILNLCSVVLIVVGFIIVFANYWLGLFKYSLPESFHIFRTKLAGLLVVALEILVIADVIATITLDATFESLMSLTLLLIVRTWLSWSLELEVEGHWPWQAAKKD